MQNENISLASEIRKESGSLTSAKLVQLRNKQDVSVASVVTRPVKSTDVRAAQPWKSLSRLGAESDDERTRRIVPSILKEVGFKLSQSPARVDASAVEPPPSGRRVKQPPSSSLYSHVSPNWVQPSVRLAELSVGSEDASSDWEAAPSSEATEGSYEFSSPTVKPASSEAAPESSLESGTSDLSPESVVIEDSPSLASESPTAASASPAP